MPASSTLAGILLLYALRSATPRLVNCVASSSAAVPHLAQPLLSSKISGKRGQLAWSQRQASDW